MSSADVAASLARVAAHYPSVDRAEGAGCTPPVMGDGIGRPWRCEVSYATSPARTVAYKLSVRRNGCWSATPGPRSGGPRYSACGLRVKRG